jgi:hypothetical protein
LNESPNNVKLQKYKMTLIILSIILATSIFVNLYLFLQPNTIVGLVDHKVIGKGTNESGDQIEWYTISLWIQRDDTVNQFSSGETIAYIVDKKIYDEVNDGDSIEGKPQSGIKLDVTNIVKRNLE